MWFLGVSQLQHPVTLESLPSSFQLTILMRLVDNFQVLGCLLTLGTALGKLMCEVEGVD